MSPSVARRRLLLALTTLPLASLAVLPGAARADEAAPGQPELVVLGRGLQAPPASPAYGSTDIAGDRLNQAASGRIEDALASVAGFQQFRRSDSRSSNPSAQGVTLRALGGNATSRTLVLLDGVPMADPFFGYVPLSALSPERLAGARVTRGGGSGAFGAGAVAGTIELASASADQLGRFAGSALVDDRGDTELAGTFAPQLGSGFAVLSGRWDRGPGFWTTPPAQRAAASVRARYESWSAGLRAVAPITSDIELQARVLAFRDNRTLRFAGADTGTAGEDASLRLVGRGAWQFDVLGYVQRRDFTNVVVSAVTFRPTLNQRATPSTGAGGKIELRPPVGGGHLLRLGGDWRVATGETLETGLTPTVTYRRAGGTNGDLGVFAEDDWTLGALILTAGARADRWSIRSGHASIARPDGTFTSNLTFADRSGWLGSLRGGAVAQVSPGLKLRAAGYTGLRLPTLNELYRSFVVAGVTTNRNPLLKAERLAGFEAGLDLAPLPGVSLSVTAFTNRVRDAIANVTSATDPNQRTRANVAAIQARGLEFAAHLERGPVSFDGSLALTDAAMRAPGQALNGKRPAQTPKVAAALTAAFRPATGWTAALTLRHVGAQFEDDLQTDVLPAATTLDAFVQLPLAGPASLVLRGENLTDTRIITRNSGGTVDLGVPRTLWVGLRVGLR
ncbi:TonB-dependent receptor [Novosphingobium piscinae]|uniref:TonB-dependent receptor n=1 Tax=Novosphingobium piscinae TaxID=1507448 RepID=A0A7X1G011_9SPHN|nr:TonB-dependent receptor [Novosphingobium piscinae]MBC2670081.1 TonB-dependent receptor [Novosphingobium piscinae]